MVAVVGVSSVVGTPSPPTQPVLLARGVTAGVGASSSRTVSLNATFGWDTGTRTCRSRPGSVICIPAQRKVSGVGLVEYERDAVMSGGTTTDGCSQFSTLGRVWVRHGKGSIVLVGTPAPDCGGTDHPDAHYLFTLKNGHGVLAGATGSGDIVADHGKDIWHGTLHAPHLPR